MWVRVRHKGRERGDRDGGHVDMSNKLSVVQVADINPGSDGSGPFGFTEHRGELYFSAFEP